MGSFQLGSEVRSHGGGFGDKKHGWTMKICSLTSLFFFKKVTRDCKQEKKKGVKWGSKKTKKSEEVGQSDADQLILIVYLFEEPR